MLHAVYDQSQCSTIVSNARYMKESYQLKCVQHCEARFKYLHMCIAKVNVHKSNEYFKPNIYLVVTIFPMHSLVFWSRAHAHCTCTVAVINKFTYLITPWP